MIRLLHSLKATLSVLATLVRADCPLVFDSTPATDVNNDFTYNIGDIVTTPQLCEGTGDGIIT